MENQQPHGFQRSLRWIGKVALIGCGLSLLVAGPATAQHVTTEPLLEAPLHRIPKGLSFEDYQDANRRVGLGLFYGVVPGGIHFYANEDTSGWILTGTALAGVAMIVAGVSLKTEKTLTNDKYETTQIGSNIYYKVPVWLEEGEGGITGFELQKVKKTEERLTTAGGVLLGVGIASLVASYIWDLFHGVHVIEAKRDRARYKIGQMLNNESQTPSEKEKKPEVNEKKPEVTVTPVFDPLRLAGGVQVQLTF